MASNANTGQGAKILIVEDEFLVALQIEEILEDEGYRILGMVPDRASLATVADAPDVVLVDLNLRDGLTGPEIARQLAAQHGCKVVYVTANPNQIDQPAPTAVGVVQKPFSRQAILSAVLFALNGADGIQPPVDLSPLPTRH